MYMILRCLMLSIDLDRSFEMAPLNSTFDSYLFKHMETRYQCSFYPQANNLKQFHIQDLDSSIPFQPLDTSLINLHQLSHRQIKQDILRSTRYPRGGHIPINPLNK